MIAFLDACAIIYWVEMSDLPYRKFVEKMHQLRNRYNSFVFAASELSLLECLVKPIRENNKEITGRYQIFFDANDLKLIPINRTIIENATLFRAHYNLAAPDALQAASAISISEEIIFITGDKSFKKIPNLNVVIV